MRGNPVTDMTDNTEDANTNWQCLHTPPEVHKSKREALWCEVLILFCFWSCPSPLPEILVVKQVRIQDLVKGGAPGPEAESCRRSEAESRERSEQLVAGVQGRLRALEAFGFLMLKYAFSHILETLFLSFLTSISTPKVDKNRTLHGTSINLKHSYILHLLSNLHEKVMLWLNNLRRYAEWSEARKFYDMGGEKYINCVTGNTLFQSNVSVNDFKVEIYI